MENTIIHIDMDAFYASVEQRDHPEYRNKPLIVGGTSNRGVVAAASYEARAFGVKSAMPIFTAKKLCPHAICVLPNMKTYQEESEKIMAIMNRYTPLIEPLSLDEAYLEVGGSKKLFGSAEVIGKKIQTAIQEELQLSSSIGIAPNKFLAKIASEMKKPKGFFTINWEDRHKILDPLPVTAIGGIGKKTAEVILALGIRTIKDLRNTPAEILRSCLGNQTDYFLGMAKGEDNRLVTLPEAPLSIGREHTFGEDIYREDQLKSNLQSLADDVASRLRNQKYAAYTITLKIKYADFTLITRSVTTENASSQTKQIYQTGLSLLEKVKDIRKKGVRLIGISASQLTASEEGQLYLFEDQVDEKQQSIDKVMDNIRARYGKKIIFPGGVMSTEPQTNKISRKEKEKEK
jgi:DNA polymerase-4